MVKAELPTTTAKSSVITEYLSQTSTWPRPKMGLYEYRPISQPKLERFLDNFVVKTYPPRINLALKMERKTPEIKRFCACVIVHALLGDSS